MYIDKGRTYVSAQTDKLIFFIEALSNTDLLNPSLIIEEFQLLEAFD